MYEDRINSISKENEFDNISIDNQRILQVIHKIKTPGRYLMNIYNKYTDPETTVSPACDRYSDDFYITIPEAGLSTRLANDSINNYLPSKRDTRRYKKAINKFEDEDDSDVSTDIDSSNEITDLYEPCDAANNNNTSRNAGSSSNGNNNKSTSQNNNSSSSTGNNNQRSNGGSGDGDKNNNKGDKVDDKRDGSYSRKNNKTDNNKNSKYHDKHAAFLSRFVGRAPAEGFSSQERYTAPFYAKVRAAAGASGGVSAVSMPSGGAHTKSRELKDIYNKQSVIKIKNIDSNCFWYALAVATMNGENRDIKKRESALIKAGKFLCDRFNYQWGSEVSIDQIVDVEEQYKGINIYVLDANNLPLLNTTINLTTSLLYKSEYNEDSVQCWLLFNNGHFDVITNIEAFLAVRHFCMKCFKTFYHKNTYTAHECMTDLSEKNKDKTPYNKIHFLKDSAHYLKRGYNLGSDREIINGIKFDFYPYKEELKKQDDELTNRDILEHFAKYHKNKKGDPSSSAIKASKSLWPTYITYDFETRLSPDFEHIPNLCIARKTQVQGDGSYKHSEKLDHKIFEGDNCLSEFCEYLLDPINGGCTIMAHNQSGYDGKFILSWFIAHGKTPDKFVQQGSKLTYFYIRKNDLRFIDSLSFFLCPLSALSELFGIETVKGFFPHKFNTLENQNYVGEIPSREMYGGDEMKVKQRKKFNEWYDSVQDTTNWNFRDEFIKYCEDDVQLLTESIFAFRQILIKKCRVDPFRYITIASLAMAVYTNNHMPESTIVSCSNKKQSFASLEWMISLNNVEIKPEIPIDIVVVEADKCAYYKPGTHTFTVDGFDKATNTIYEFYGCFFHGCLRCYQQKKSNTYSKTLERENILKQNGYNIISMWECSFVESKEQMELEDRKSLETQGKESKLNVRDALFGGRTEGFKSYVKCGENQKIVAYDVVSLYPTVNALDDYAVDFHKLRHDLTVEEIRNGSFFGIAKVDTWAPKQLQLPVLPENKDGRLLFHLNNIYGGTYTSIELQKALEVGYKIIKIHVGYEYKKYNGLMRDYVKCFVKMKIENTECYTKEEADAINKYHTSIGVNINLDYKNCSENPGMRAISKLFLNALWGKFGMRSNLDQREFISDYTSFVRKCTDPKIKKSTFDIINENCVEFIYKSVEGCVMDAKYISEVTAVFTTSNARIRLYNFLSWFHPSQRVYCDTDSVYIFIDYNNKDHRCPVRDNLLLPPCISLGDGLGQWKYDIEDGAHIIEQIVNGCKSYAYKRSDGKESIKQKGITLDYNNSQLLHLIDLNH